MIATPHAPVKRKGIPWLCCQRCGLVYLHNELTSWCIRMGCDHSERPEYKIIVKRLSSVFEEDT
jgi:hypothetical protein